MKKALGCLFVFTKVFSFASAAAELNCLQAPSRIEPCANLVYRAALDPITQQKKIFCFCKTDFKHLSNPNLSEAEKAFNKMEWQQLVAESGYSEAQIRSIVNGKNK